jgi:DNA-binding NtrC family response regulator
VRELENALRAASLFAETSTITLANLTENVDDLRRTADSRDGFRAVTPTPPPSPSVLVAPPSVQLEDDSEEGGEADGERPLPVDEANATAVAYAQVRQGALSLSDLKRQIERDCIARALAETKGNITRAATLLGMKRPRLSQLVKHYGLAAVSSEAS